MSSRMGTLNLALALEGRVKAARENEQLVVIAEAMAELPDPQIDRGFMFALEQLILTEDLAVQQAGQQTQPTRHLEAVPATVPAPAEEPVRRAPVVQMPKRRLVVRRSLVAVAAAMSLMAFPVVASGSALPGSPLYGLKLRIERIQLAWFGTPSEDVLRLAGLANVRVDEIEQLNALHADSSLIRLALAGYEEILRQMASIVRDHSIDRATLREVGAMARDAEVRLRSMEATVSPAAADELDGAIFAAVSLQRAVDDALGIDLPSINVMSGLRGQRIATTDRAGRPAGSGTQNSGGGGSNNDTDGPKPDRFAENVANDPGNTEGHLMSEVAEGCEVPLATETGDLFAPVAKVMCS